MKYSFLPLAFLLATLLSLGCNGGKGNGSDSDSTASDTVVSIELDPSAFPVNAIPDNQFGKPLPESIDPSVGAVPAALPLRAEKLPESVDAIVSRESIVQFGKIMAASPDELEFVQQESKLFDAGKGCTAYYATFKTRPSEFGMVVFGAYLNDTESYWASTYRKGPMSILLGAATAVEGGMEIRGGISTDADPNMPFKAVLKKESGTIAYAHGAK
jgi:hypothetical protein